MSASDNISNTYTINTIDTTYTDPATVLSNTIDTNYTDPATVLSSDSSLTTNTSPATEPSSKGPTIVDTGSPTGAQAATETDENKTNSASNIAASATTKPGKGATNNSKTSKANGSNTKNARAPVTRSRTVSSNSPVVSDSTRSKTKSNLPNYLHTPKQSGTSLLSPSTSYSRATNNNSRTLMPEHFREIESNLLSKFKNLLSTFEQNMKDEINGTIAALCSRVQQCERDILTLRQENEKIRDQLEDSHRQQRLSDVIVSGLLPTSNKSPVDLVKQIANKLQHTLTPHFDAFRLRSQNQRHWPVAN
ncbi:dentin sialophosphoprotein-like [Episyrphus balteatus]|uniref:dentin sialophosphoprotein-like n=1 Tax=Episyrphus balteatus TaxID=286459 RepID=UPI002486A65D|nr:dentin sialophosphoprotein-like [Episyrphus balteatus]